MQLENMSAVDGTRKVVCDEWAEKKRRTFQVEWKGHKK